MIRSGRYFALALLLASCAGLNADISTAVKKAEKEITGLFTDVQSTVVVDMESLLGDLQNELKGMQEGFQKEMEAMGKKRQELDAKKKDVKDPKEIDKKIADLDKEGQAKMQGFQGKMQAKQVELQKKAEDRMEKVKKYADSKGHKLVLPKQGVLHCHDSLDITKDIKKHLGLK